MNDPRRPRLQLKITAERACCGRCGEFVGAVLPGFRRVYLAHKRGYGWMYTIKHLRPLDDGVWEFSLKRRRDPNPALGGPVNTVGDAEVIPGEVVVCPNCKARQTVPSA